MDTGVLILRIVVGTIMVGHGGQKLFGWFGGFGPRGTGAYLAGLGYRPGLAFAVAAGLSEAGAGLLLGLGLATPLAGALLIATMINVASGHEGKGFWNHNGGWEFMLVLGVVGVALAFTGGGTHSLDAELSWAMHGQSWGISALAGGLAAGLVPRAGRRRIAERTLG
jgi:putative oxidoreductase